MSETHLLGDLGGDPDRVEDDWTEEDEAQMADLVKKIDALAEDDELGEGEDDPEDIDSDHD